MALSFIDRDGHQLVKYGQDAREIVDQMEKNVRITEGVLEACRNRLDDNARQKIDELHECCSEFYRHSALYL